MKNALLFLLLFPLAVKPQYSFSGYEQPYTYLSGATTYYTLPWDESTPFLISIPIGFTFKYFGQSVTTITPTSLGLITLGDGSQFDAYLNVFGASLRSKGAQSPMSYKTEGTSGSRIFKFEIKNAGFYYEYDSTNVVNNQVWLYEGSNIIEYHYGHGQYHGGAVIYQLEFGPSIGLSYSNGNSDYQLRLIYNPYWPDTITDLANEHYIAGGPWDSLVYRFTPSGFNAIKDFEKSVDISIYPTPTTDKIFITAEELIEAVEVYNLLGEPVNPIPGNAMKQKGVLRTAEIDVAELPKGVYLVRVSFDPSDLRAGKLRMTEGGGLNAVRRVVKE